MKTMKTMSVSVLISTDEGDFSRIVKHDILIKDIISLYIISSHIYDDVKFIYL